LAHEDHSIKITAYYYLDYPDCLPDDPGYAATRMYVEVGEATSTTENFSDTYAFQVYTVRYVEEEYFRKHIPLFGRSVLVVPELTDVWMFQFLNDNVDELNNWGEVV
jgi:hypothetical protein